MEPQTAPAKKKKTSEQLPHTLAILLGRAMSMGLNGDLEIPKVHIVVVTGEEYILYGIFTDKDPHTTTTCKSLEELKRHLKPNVPIFRLDTRQVFIAKDQQRPKA